MAEGEVKEGRVLSRRYLNSGAGLVGRDNGDAVKKGGFLGDLKDEKKEEYTLLNRVNLYEKYEWQDFSGVGVKKVVLKQVEKRVKKVVGDKKGLKGDKKIIKVGVSKKIKLEVDRKKELKK